MSAHSGSGVVDFLSTKKKKRALNWIDQETESREPKSETSPHGTKQSNSVRMGFYWEFYYEGKCSFHTQRITFANGGFLGHIFSIQTHIKIHMLR